VISQGAARVVLEINSSDDVTGVSHTHVNDVTKYCIIAR
jgi:hypothetical protein